ncbi:DUF2726 domain-containing protein [Paucibacter sp. APW11]|uniref:DUF2726 domain-containing protein n=1 Tax=Roseateles aquae TaxID=3077235 RepID=A0ABU3PIA1_9BURK|nr:DUF2726 domain-containing protein [Paucibacter sp. APW11]MDT9002189.1 DUF2726 domain-containing protein [Paucibacter sp. APW11]
MQTTVPWIIALLACAGLLVLTLLWAFKRSGTNSKQLPTEWSLTARPVFSTDERRVHRLLKEALPHHVILSKLPLVRFCQPTEAKEVRYWFELLGSINVTFAICSPNGRVLAAVDLDSERSVSGRSLQIKQAVLGACRVRYLRCPIDNLPSPAELQLLVPFSSSARGPLPAPAPQVQQSRHGNASAPRRNGLWQDSAMFGDSFFAPDSRYDSATGRSLQRDGAEALHASRPLSRGAFSEPMGLDSQYPDEASNDIVGVVVDTPRYGMR